jgi:hypothetical protein
VRRIAQVEEEGQGQVEGDDPCCGRVLCDKHRCEETCRGQFQSHHLSELKSTGLRSSGKDEMYAMVIHDVMRPGEVVSHECGVL